MAGSVVTVDFHNTLVECDQWFDLEVRSLVSSVLRWAAVNNGAGPPSVAPHVVDSAYRKLRLAIHTHGHELEAERATAVVLDRFGVALERDVIATAVRELMHSTLSSARPVKGADQFLRELRTQGARIAVVSSAVYHPFLEWALERFNLLDHIDLVITSASCGFYKSRPEIYWAALDALAAPAHESAHIGDSLRFDVGGASMAGMKAAWYDRSASQRARDPDYIPDLVVTELESASAQMLELIGNSDGSRTKRGYR